MKLISSLLACLLVGAVCAIKRLRTDREVLAEFRAENYLQNGDMYIRRPPSDQNGRMDWDVFRNWPENTIPFVVSNNVSNNLRQVIKTSINYLHTYTCVKFRPLANKDKYWIRFMMDPRLEGNPNSDMMCAAEVSFQEKQDQGVYLGPKCHAPSMVHELMHTIGLFHEHNRNDRDWFITIHPQNMTEEAKGQYIKDKDWCILNKFPEKQCTMKDYGLNYNYDSLMHYCQSCGGINGKNVYTLLNNKTALGKPENVGQAYGLSEGDWLLINRKYGCDPAQNPEIRKPPPIPKNPPKFGKPETLTESSIKPAKDSCKRKLRN